MKLIRSFPGLIAALVSVVLPLSSSAAPADSTANPHTPGTTNQWIGKINLDYARQHWAFRPPANPPVPNPEDGERWIKTPVDAFILAKLRQHNVRPSHLADRQTLIRRATYDLTGLPPTPAEVDQFLNDTSPGAFASLVDRLLQSPRYGERWARHWLDVARYADTSGDRNNRGDARYPYAWTYRDYVIQAFNRDVPFDQFIIEQIAADRVPESQPSTLAALGFLTVGKRFMNNVNEIIDDRIDVVTQGFMALTVSCARCHDHKFDPVPTRDYYSLHGIFNSSVEPDEKPLLVEPKWTPDYEDYIKQLADIEAEVKAFRMRELERVLASMREKISAYLLASLELEGSGRQANLPVVARKHRIEANHLQFWQAAMERWERSRDPVFGPWFAFSKLPKEEFASRAESLVRKHAESSGLKVNPFVARAFREIVPSSIEQAAEIYARVFKEASDAQQSAPALLADESQAAQSESEDASAELPDPDVQQVAAIFLADNHPLLNDDRILRRVLGNQIQNRENQIRAKAVSLHLTHPASPPRAMVLEDTARPRDSRILVRGEPRNFGPVVPRQFLDILTTGERKPFSAGSGRLELANAIANRENPLTARVIVNRVWQWHFGEGIVRTPNDFGLRAESPSHPELLDYLATWFIDNGWSLRKLHRLLMTSSVYQQSSAYREVAASADPENHWLWRMNLQRLDFEALRDTILFLGGEMDSRIGGPPIPPNELLQSSRRTIYAMVDRLALPETFRIFDFANPDMTSGERHDTTVPQQALFMMNSPFVAAQARKLARRPEILSQPTTEEKVNALFRIVYQRLPHARETSLALGFIGNYKFADGEITAEERPSRDERRLDPANRAARRNNSDSMRDRKPLDPWEQYVQVLLLGNELVYVN